MSIALQAERLMALARTRAPADRERLLLAITELCDNAEIVGQLESASVQALLNDIFMCLVVEAERDIRRRLADKLADARWAPRALVNVLALDDIEIARPIIAASPVLQDRDLIRLLVDATIEHQIEVARRPSLSPLVADAIVAEGEPSVLTALAANETAQISGEAMGRLVEASRTITSLRPPLARHPRLTTTLAEQLYVWVGQSLRTAIVARFKVDAEALERAIAAAVSESHANPDAPEAPPSLAIERPGGAGGDGAPADRQAARRRPASAQLPAARPARGQAVAVRGRPGQARRLHPRADQPGDQLRPHRAPGARLLLGGRRPQRLPHRADPGARPERRPSRRARRGTPAGRWAPSARTRSARRPPPSGTPSRRFDKARRLALFRPMSKSAPRLAFVASERPEAKDALAALTARYGSVSPEEADVLVALGGDGVMLETLHRSLPSAKPIYGMNRGSVGFLMNDYREDGLVERIAAAEQALIHRCR